MRENKKINRYKLSKLEEWVNLLSSKEWKGVSDMVEGKLFYISPLSLAVLGKMNPCLTKLKSLILSGKRGTDFSLDNFNKITRTKLNEKEWLTVKSEISKACTAYKKFQLVQKRNPFIELELQSFFLENNMFKNLDTIQNSNHKLLNQSKIKDNYSGVWMTRNRELKMTDVRNKNIRKNLLNLNDLQYSVELFYHENKLRILSEKIARNIFSKEYGISQNESNWLQHIPNEIKNTAQIKIYSTVFNMLHNNCDDAFENLKNLISSKDIKNKVSIKYMANIYGYLIVYCTKRINDGKIEFAHQYLEFISSLEKDNLLLEQGNIPIWRMKNVIKVASKVDAFDWARDFIFRQKNRLDKKEKNAILDYCLGLLSYEKGDYQKAYEQLHCKDSSQDTLIKVDTLILYLFILLQLEDEDFTRQRDNLRSIVRYSKEEKVKGKISDDVVKKWRKSINYLSHVQESFELEDFKKIKTDITNDIFFPGKAWLKDYLDKKIGSK